MKNLIFLPFAAICLAFSEGVLTDDLPEHKSPESMPEYEITSKKKVATLPAGSTFVMFTFNADGFPVNDTILMSCNGKQQKIITDQKGQFALQTTAGKTVFQFFLDTKHFELHTDSIDLKDQFRTDITVWFTNSELPVMVEKPVIYVYPDKTTDVNIQLDVKGKLGYTYPQYNDGWNFTADPDGTIHMNGKTYEYLFWDAAVSTSMGKDGFIVKRDSLTTFFEEKLTTMGLNAREREDFITYWCPRMTFYNSCFVHFAFTKECDALATMNIAPKPDHVFRVYMMWNDAGNTDPKSVAPQKIETFTREGFSVVEWGGAQFFNVTYHENLDELSIDEPGIH